MEQRSNIWASAASSFWQNPHRIQCSNLTFSTFCPIFASTSEFWNSKGKNGKKKKRALWDLLL